MRQGGDRARLMGQRLLRQAAFDLQSARHNLVPAGYYVAANLAHQAAEKGLKAAHWYVRGEEPPWRHDLGAVAERVAERTGVLPFEVDLALDRIEPLFERTRYPSGNPCDPIPTELIDQAVAQMATEDAEEVLQWVRTLFQQTWP